jgi:hypothetical protein
MELTMNARITVDSAGRILTKEKGVWVFRGGGPIPASVTDDILQQIRTERDLQNAGTGESVAVAPILFA